jgi:hypothetical protein
MTSFLMNPERVAHYEASGWKAYYERDWAKLLALIVRLSQEQFLIPFPVSCLAAYYIVRASIAWVPINHNILAVQKHYTRFYRLAKHYSGLNFQPEKAGQLETQYNDVHRRLVNLEDKTEFIQTLTLLHAEIFGLSPTQARASAELRVLANNTVDRITGKTSLNIEADWRLLEDYLRRAYTLINEQLTINEKSVPRHALTDRL